MPIGVGEPKKRRPGWLGRIDAFLRHSAALLLRRGPLRVRSPGRALSAPTRPEVGDTLDVLRLYRLMARARAFETVVSDLWRRGRISGEMHLGTGEEAINAGVVDHLQDGDMIACDHRAHPPFVLRGAPPAAILGELLGREDGLCAGRGGHMHLFSREIGAAASGIVGSSAPLGAGFALSMKQRGSGGVAVAFFGDGAANAGMLLETLNLASVWSLPMLFVCKDNGWAVTTISATVTGGDLAARARAFGIPARRVDGLDVAAIWCAAEEGVRRARRGGGPTFLLARCGRLDGHFLGDVLLRTAHHPIGEGSATLLEVTRNALARKGGGIASRVAGVAHLTRIMAKARFDGQKTNDPIHRAREVLPHRRDELDRIDAEAREEMEAAARAAQAEAAA